MTLPDRDRVALAEVSYQRAKDRRIRRQPVVLLAVVQALVLAVGLTAAVDLGRLATPRGTALAWVEAAVLGDCVAYARLSVPADPRPADQACTALRRATATARTELARIGLAAGPASVAGTTAEVPVTVLRPEGRLTVRLPLVRHDGAWRVVRTDAVCAAFGCP